MVRKRNNAFYNLKKMKIKIDLPAKNSRIDKTQLSLQKQ